MTPLRRMYTGEQDLAAVFTQDLRADLDQSPLLQVASDAKMHETLVLMEQPAGAALGEETARAGPVRPRCTRR